MSQFDIGTIKMARDELDRVFDVCGNSKIRCGFSQAKLP
jgi:hypothetical protein